MPDRSKIIVSGVLCLFFSAFSAAAMTYAPEARLMPLVVGIPAALLSLLQCWHDIRSTPGTTTNHQEAKILSPSMKMLLWFIAAVLITLALGILPAAWLFVLLYLRFQHGSGLVAALLLSSGFVATLYLLVSVLLEIELLNGVIVDFTRYI